MGYLISIVCGTCNKVMAKGDTVLDVQAAAEPDSIIIPNQKDGCNYHCKDQGCVIMECGKHKRNMDKLHVRKQYKERKPRGGNDGTERIDSIRTGTD